MLGESISFGGVGALGFAIGAPGDPTIWSSLDDSQKQWVTSTLNKLNDVIIAKSGTHCPGWPADLVPGNDSAVAPALACFQMWWNANRASPNGPGKPLRGDGILDQDTLCALITIQQLDPSNFAVTFPDHGKNFCMPSAPIQPTPSPSPAAEKKGLSTGAMVGIGVAGAAVFGGIIYAATRPRYRR
jgi:hypothetical protein